MKGSLDMPPPRGHDPQVNKHCFRTTMMDCNMVGIGRLFQIRAGDVTQLVEHSSSKDEALG